MLKGKVAVVTGSTSGIGLGIASALAQQGADIVLNGFGDAADIEKLRAGLASQYGVQVRYDGADLSKGEAVRQLVSGAVAELGRIDILVNNAGIQHTALIEDFPADKWDAIIALNLSAVFHGIGRGAAPHEEAGLGAHHQHRLGPWPGGLGREVRLRGRQARRGRPDQGHRAGDGRHGHHRQRHLPRLGAHAVGGKADHRPGGQGRRRPGKRRARTARREAAVAAVRHARATGRHGRVPGLEAAAQITGTTISVDGGWTAR